MRLEHQTRRFYLGRDYSEALFGFGATPIHLPLIPDAEFVSSALDGLDGILLPGADCDPDPALYGEDPHPELRRVVPKKDETDLLVLAEAERRNLPVLGICFGMQILNVARGGSLVQDISSQVEGSIKHEQGIPLEREWHAVTVENDSRLHPLMGDDDRIVKVNSHHHQAVKAVGTHLVESAFAPDGVIEAIEDDRDDRFVLGVQWHPELGWRDNEMSRRIFIAFIDECKTRREVNSS